MLISSVDRMMYISLQTRQVSRFGCYTCQETSTRARSCTTMCHILIHWTLYISRTSVWSHWGMTYEPRHDKTNKMSVHPAKTQISLGICPVWSASLQAHMPLKWFCHVAAKLCNVTFTWNEEVSWKWLHRSLYGFVSMGVCTTAQLLTCYIYWQSTK